MKGLIFTSFTEFVELNYGAEYLDRLLGSLELSTCGAYTNVGTYPSQELIDMLTFIHADKKADVSALTEAFGVHTFRVLELNYGGLLQNYNGAFECIYHVDQTIHKSVRKIHPDVELPKMNAELHDNGRQLTLEYRSSRPFMHFARGLLKGCANYFSEEITIQMKDLSNGAGTHALFELRKDD